MNTLYISSSLTICHTCIKAASAESFALPPVGSYYEYHEYILSSYLCLYNIIIHRTSIRLHRRGRSVGCPGQVRPCLALFLSACQLFTHNHHQFIITRTNNNTISSGKDKVISQIILQQGVQEKLCFFHNSLQQFARRHPCKRPSKLSTQCKCTLTPIGL